MSFTDSLVEPRSNNVPPGSIKEHDWSTVFAMKDDPYSTYLRFYGRVASGARLTDADYRVTRFRRLFRPQNQAADIAIALAVHDVNQDSALKSKGEFEAELKRLLG